MTTRHETGVYPARAPLTPFGFGCDGADGLSYRYSGAPERLPKRQIRYQSIEIITVKGSSSLSSCRWPIAVTTRFSLFLKAEFSS